MSLTVRSAGRNSDVVDVTTSPFGAGGDAATAGGRREATRYLCAAAYLDAKFRESVLDQVFNHNCRFVASSHGVDVVAVVRHCLVARRRARVRDAILTGILAGMLVSALVGLAVVAWLMVVLAWLVVVVDTVLTRYRIVAGHVARLPFDPADAPPAPPDAEERLAELAADEEANVVVYSGYSPFVGSGYEVGAWSFAVNTDRPKGGVDGGKSPTPFEASEIHDAVARALRTLPLDGLAVEDRLFVSGKHVRDDRRFLPDQFSRPVARVGPEVVEQVRRAPTPAARVYLDVRVVDWQGELVFSTFVRFSKTGDCLFAEASHFVLPSLASHYHDVDGLTPQPTLRSLATIARQSLVTLPMVIPASAAKAVMGAAGPSRRSLEDRSVRRSVRENNAFDYGATTSIRQQGTATAYQRYFQLLDKEMYLKVVERRLIDTILAFLDEKGVDTSDLRQQSQHIYNNGVIVNGGALNTHNVAVGTGARATASGAFQALANAVVPSAPAGGTK